MKILKESTKKEELPLSFLTAFTSDSWATVGVLKEDIAAIKREYTGTAKIEKLIQDLVDAYLVCIGQMEKHMADNDYIELPTESIKEALTEAVVEEPAEAVANSLDEDEDGFEAVVRPDLDDGLALAEISEEVETADDDIDDDFFDCNFDAPVGKKLTDDDIYED